MDPSQNFLPDKLTAKDFYGLPIAITDVKPKATQRNLEGHREYVLFVHKKYADDTYFIIDPLSEGGEIDGQRTAAVKFDNKWLKDKLHLSPADIRPTGKH